MERNLTHAEVEALIQRVLGERAHALVDIVQTSDSYDQAVAAVSQEFGLTNARGSDRDGSAVQIARPI